MLTTKKLRLVPIQKKHSPILFNWINHRENVLFNNAYKPVNELAHDEWFEWISKTKDVILFGIELVETSQLIGSVQINQLNTINRSAHFSMRIGETNLQGKGYGTEAVAMTLKFAFDDLNLNRLYAFVFEHNIRALKTYEKTGWKIEGKQRQAEFLDGKYVDVLNIAILKSDLNNAEYRYNTST